jgi:hypothetical protein
VIAAPTISSARPIAASGVSTGAIPVSAGMINPSAPATSPGVLSVNLFARWKQRAAQTRQVQGLCG